MIIVLTSTAPPQLSDLGRFDRLHAELHGDMSAARLDDLCRAGDDDHVWLDIDAARSVGAELADDASFASDFDAMIAFARRSGWVDESGTHVRAHVVASD